jgi:DNA-binding CsgD family transcriptional regulator
VLRAVGYTDQDHLPLAGFEITLALTADGPAAAIAAMAQVMDAWDLSGGGPRYVWPVVVAAASACIAATRRASATGDERLSSDAAAIGDRLRTTAEKLDAVGQRQHAFRLTFTAADAVLTGGDDLARRWDEATAAWDAVGEPYPLAQTLLRSAEAAIADGDREAAAARLRRAASIATDLGAHPLGEEIATLARRARITLGNDAPSAGQDPAGGAGLTERELEVLRLVAAGRSNREIATELFISPKTASVHVSNILGKLGATSRTEAAAKAHTLRLLG